MMRVGKKLMWTVAWLVVFVIVTNLISAANVGTKPSEDLGGLAGSSFMLLVVGVIGFTPLIMAILVWFGRPKWLYSRKKK